ncbi:MAG TPA: SRPBCC family protein [Steroidobacteraceae bacterium]|nr:SRPBCC family protein [Steroidobacteraceae bacterium]
MADAGHEGRVSQASGGIEQLDLGGLSFWTQPNSWHHFMSDHIVSFSVLPISPHSTLLRARWLVHKDAQEGIDYDLKRLKEVWDATNDQDSSLIENAHRGIIGPAYEPGPYSPFTEGLVDKFCNGYLDRLAAGLDVAGFTEATDAAGAASATRPAHSAPDRGPGIAADAPLAVGPDARVFSVTFSQSGRTVPCRAAQSILTAAESAGLPLPFSWREGKCGTCRSRLVSGHVDMRHAGGIRQRQIDMGDILVCCSRPVSDLVIDK